MKRHIVVLTNEELASLKRMSAGTIYPDGLCDALKSAFDFGDKQTPSLRDARIILGYIDGCISKEKVHGK